MDERVPIEPELMLVLQPVPLPQPVVDYGRQLGLVQRWEIFNDMDRLFFGWLVVVGQQEDGRRDR